MLHITAFYDRLALNTALAMAGFRHRHKVAACGGAQKP
jgi:hypothetical protein